jgi:hypothetical protein
MTECIYEVMSPWAEADPVPFQGINPRPADLAGKKIGLLVNSKRAAEPTLKVVEDRLKKRYPAAAFSWFANLTPNQALVELPAKEQFEDWLKGLDAVVAAYGD